LYHNIPNMRSQRYIFAFAAGAGRFGIAAARRPKLMTAALADSG
jgi:hypothetical protein